MMTVRERILATLRGQPVDRIPWVPRWDLWYKAARRDGRLPAAWRGLSLHDCTRRLGWGIQGREASVHREVQAGLEVRERRHGEDICTEWVTPVGTISQQVRVTAELAAMEVRGRIVKPFIQDPSDYGPAIWAVEHTRVEPAYDEFLAYDAAVGDDGVSLAQVPYCPAHRLMREFTDYEGFYYQLADHPGHVEDLLAAMARLDDEIQRVAVASPALIVQSDGNYDDQLTPAPIYRRFILPRHQRLAERLHAAGKYFCTHTDGHHEQLLGLIAESGVDIAEAFTTPPMTRVGVARARQAWGHRITIWGGLAANMFSAFTPDDEFEAHVRQVLHEAAPGDHFILGTGDNIPTDAELPRLLRLTELIDELVTYPLRVLPP